MLNDELLERYSRQILLPEIDLAGQENIQGGSVLVVGCGGLGSMVALFLAGAGVGNLTLVDADSVELSNLHRQLAFRESDIAQPKAQALKHQLLSLNSEITVTSAVQRFGDDRESDAELLRAANIVIDATDNLASRHAIERSTRDAQKPWIRGRPRGFTGRLLPLVRREQRAVTSVWHQAKITVEALTAVTRVFLVRSLGSSLRGKRKMR